ncbi:MAG: GLUG motif-containing protein [Phocaeicola plebeius]
MKRFSIFLLMTAWLLSFASCSDQDNPSGGNGNEVEVTFALNLEGNHQVSRAISDGSQAKKLVYAVYDESGNVLSVFAGGQSQKEVSVPQNMTSVAYPITIKLAKGQTYTVAFWAQNPACTAYNTTDLKAVSINYTNAVNNDEAWDAFYAAEEITVQNNETRTVTLKRALAQINVGVSADEWAAAMASGVTVTRSEATIKQVASTINLLDGTVKNPVDMTWSQNVIPSEALLVDMNNDRTPESYHYLSMTYILVNDATTGSAQATLEDASFTFHAVGKEPITLHEGLTNVPVQRNWRTNIIGQILTGDVTFNIKIDPTYENDHNEGPLVVQTIAEANTAFKNGATSVSIASVEGNGGTIVLPKTTMATSLTLPDVPAASSPVIIQYAAGTSTSQRPEALELSTTGTVGNLTVSAENTSVNMNNGNYTSVTASTADNTLVVGEDVVIDDLTVKKGSVEIHGVVKNLTNNASSSITYQVGSASELLKLADAINRTGETGRQTTLEYVDKIVLSDDIDMSNVNWTPMGTSEHPFAMTFDGNGKTISNLNIQQSSTACVGLFGKLVTPGKIEGLTLKNVSVKGQSQVGAIVGSAYTGTVTNCKVEGTVQVEGNYQVGGITGAGYAAISQCSVNGAAGSYVKGTYLQANLEGDAVGGIIGYYCEGTKSLDHCTVAGVSVEGTRKVGGVVGQQGGDVTVSNCSFSGTVRSNASAEYQAANVGKLMVGGLVGELTSGTNFIITGNTVASGTTVIGFDANVTNALYGGSRVPSPTITATNNTVDGVVVTIMNSEGTVKVNGTPYADIAAALAKTTGNVTVQLMAGTYAMPTTGFADRVVTLKGVGTDQTILDMSAGGTPQYNANVTFKQLTMKRKSDAYGGLSHSIAERYEDCVVEGTLVTYAPVVSAKNTTFVQSSNSNYNVHVYAAGSTTFEDCVFKCEGKAIYAHAEAANEQNITIKNCQFKANQVVAGKTAIQLHTELSIHGSLTVEKTTAQGFDTSIHNGLWNELNNRTKEATNVFTKTFDGKTFLVEGVMKNSVGICEISTAQGLALASAQLFNNGGDYKIMNDLDMKGVTYVPATNVQQITIDGNNKVIKNLSIEGGAYGALLGRVVASGSIKNLTVSYSSFKPENVKASANANQGQNSSGAFIGWLEIHTVDGFTLENCVSANNVFTSTKYVGGLVGYHSGAQCNMTSCTVTDCSLDTQYTEDNGKTFQGHLGGLIGFFTSGTITGCRVENTVITAKTIGEKANRFGALVGSWYETASIVPSKDSPVVVNNVTINGTKVTKVEQLTGSGVNNGTLTNPTIQ